MKVSTVEQMRNMDRNAIQQYAIPEDLLMENAGMAATTLLKMKMDLCGKKIAIFCGSGNNGGDGLVVARQLASLGCRVNTFFLSDPARYQGVAKLNYDISQKFKIPSTILTSTEQLQAIPHDYDVIIDAIFGTGLVRPVEGHYADVINWINQTSIPVLSLDIPSGIHGDNGRVMGIAVQANWTVTFGLPKTGNLMYPGYAQCGDLYVSHISFPRELVEDDDIRCAVNLLPVLPERKKDGHKGTFGETLFIAGAANYYGAPYFSALSFLKAGGGYSRLAAPKSITPFIGMKGSEIVFHPQPETEDGSLSIKALQPLLELSKNVDFVVLGPGISLNSETQALAVALIEKIEKPLLIDGDGLSAITNKLSSVKKRNAPTVLTPHPGEMRRLLDTSLDALQQDPIKISRNFSLEHDTHLVLKGAHTLIAQPDGIVSINMTGNAGMATAGSGDVLTGVIAAMYGLSLPLTQAVASGVFFHGLAGDLAALHHGMDGITAQDILESLPEAVNLTRTDNLLRRFPHYQGALPL